MNPPRSSALGALTPRHLLAGFIAGAVAVLLFHQGAWAALHAAGMAPRAPFPMQPTAPFGVPQLWSLAFWGGVWGVVLAALFHSLQAGRLILAGIVFGAIAPTLVAWFLVAPLKGQPVAAGWSPAGMMFGLLVNGAWGLGTGLGFLALRGPRAARKAASERRSGADRRTRIVAVVEERRRSLADRRAALAERGLSMNKP